MSRRVEDGEGGAGGVEKMEKELDHIRLSPETQNLVVEKEAMRISDGRGSGHGGG